MVLCTEERLYINGILRKVIIYNTLGRVFVELIVRIYKWFSLCNTANKTKKAILKYVDRKFHFLFPAHCKTSTHGKY